MIEPDAPAVEPGYSFVLDTFQVAAIDALDRGHSVLVAAPTGSGKTVVAEHAVAAALRRGERAFYTTPIKALSNQKYRDLVRRHGVDDVGLLTGDNSINGDAPVVVMTTEVLRNMIYGRSSALDRLTCVVLDEVHFLQDAYRGPVWEEVIIHLPHTVQLVCLSATVSNADEVAEWMRTVRGPTDVVLETRRPVSLENLYAVGDRTSERLHVLPTFVDGRPNPEAARLDAEAVRGPRHLQHRQRGRRKLFTPGRVEMIERLDDLRLLPAIWFIFSRNACDDAAAHALDAGIRLTSAAERDAIREIVDSRLEGLDASDLAVLGYGRFLAGLEAGVAPHHAGMVPPFKEVVEECFVEGLIKVVFATETLAVGINMPARSVVIERLTKFTGERHTFLTPGEYTQLTGRAGRRGIDTEGHAVVLWSPFVPFEQVASLAASRSFTLTSAFKPTYNMAANLVRTYQPDRARQLLNLSFAQYRSDREVVRLEARLESRSAALVEARDAAVSPFGDIDDYRRRTGELPRERHTPAGRIDDALGRLRPGDVLWVGRGRRADKVVVLSVANRKGGATRVRTLTTNRIALALDAGDFDAVPRPVARIELPTPFTPNKQSFQRDVARLLERTRVAPPTDDDIVPLASADEHPVLADPDLAARLKAAGLRDRLEAEVSDLRDRVRGRGQSLARRFERVLEVLERWEYLEGWQLTDRGERLARLFHECDLLVLEALHRGLLDGLEAAELAAVVSMFVYEHRSPEQPPPPWYPDATVRRRSAAITALADELRGIELAAGLDQTRMPDPTFAAVAWAWAKGEAFADVVEDEEMSGGDFVRTTKQLMDLLRQLGDVAPEAATRHAARQAADALFRGVVAASSTVGSVS